MALYRTISLTFWTDAKIIDEFSPEDKYFYLYLLTNPHTNLSGCYEISKKQMAIELGYSIETIMTLLERFENKYNIIKLSNKTNEIFVLNWHKYNWTKSPKFRKPLKDEIEKIKDVNFKEILKMIENDEEVDLNNEEANLEAYGIDTICSDTTVTVTVTDTITDIINYLNKKLNSKYRTNNKVTIKHITARLNEGYTLEDFKIVIDKKYNEWNNTEMQQYLNPETLFGTKFEKYLNQPNKKKTLKDISIDELEEMQNEYSGVY